jgi:DNA-binding PucR family transcriptional regulator
VLRFLNRSASSSRVVALDDLGITRLLFQVEDKEELLEFANRELGPVLDYDVKHQSDLTGTLQCYLDNKCKIEAAAQHLSVHMNTLRYRLQRIQEIAGVDLNDVADLLRLELALQVRQIAGL